MHVDLSHTPGLLYALAYWLSSTFYIQLYGSPFSKGRKFGISAGFLALIAGFMTLTDGVSAIGFFPCMGVTVALIFFYIRIATHMPWANAGYYCARAFILGEFSASLAWYLFYFFVTVPGLPLTVWTTILVFAAVHAIILYTMFLLERKYRDGSKLIKITARELFTAAVLAIAVFSVSNISFAFTGTPFSSQFTAEVFIIRTTVDLGGVAMLFAYHVVILEISTEREMEHLQALLHMQYESYRISEESIALVNQKYHDLKHHIQLLRAASAAERTEYLDQMEQQIRTYEAQNKTGNRVLDTILTAKTIQCQSEGISLTCVADGHQRPVWQCAGQRNRKREETPEPGAAPDSRFRHAPEGLSAHPRGELLQRRAALCGRYADDNQARRTLPRLWSEKHPEHCPQLRRVGDN